MAKLLLFLLCLTISLASMPGMKKIGMEMPGMDISLPEIMKTFSEMEDSHSIILTDSNYNSILSNSSESWFIFFQEPRSQKSILKNPVWVIFGSHLEKQNSTLKLGRVDLSTQPDLRRKFRITSFPVFLYLENGFTYNYTGPSEVDDFEKVIDNKLYYQYDRQPFTVDNNPPTLARMFKRDFVSQPGTFIAGIFGGSFLLQLVISYLCCKEKTKRVEEEEAKKAIKRKKRE